MSPPRPETLMAAACDATGLDDFGHDTFREGLTAYCDSLAGDAQLNELGSLAIGGVISSSLANRLRVVDWAKRNPSVLREDVGAPLVVIGMFRAGTTLLSYLLDQDRRNRSLLRWESADSVPPPSPAEHRAGPRVEAARQQAALLDQLNPLASTVHREEADGPTECVSLLAQDFKSLQWEAISNVPSYSRWLLATNHRSAYEYHHEVLQVLQSGGVRGQWVLKSPHHAIALEELNAVYPEARLVLLHRDPVVLAASVCSLIRTLSSTFSDADQRAYIGSHWVAMLEESVRRIDAFRSQHPSRPVLDVQYADLVTRPVDTVRLIYDAYGLEPDESATAAITAYVAGHPKGQFGTHSYDLSDYGLRAEEVAARFEGYTTRYAIPREH